MRRKIWRGLFLSMLFFCSMILSPIIAQAHSPSTQLQSQLQITESDLLKQAQIAYKRGEFEQAITLWQQLTNQYAGQGDRLNQAMALSNLSLTHQKLGQWNAAQQAITESFNLLQDQKNLAENQRILAQTLDIQGHLQWEVGQSEKSLETWHQAAQLYESLADQDGLQKNLLNQSKALQDLGFYPKTCRTVLEAFHIEVTSDQTCNLPENILNEFLDKPDSPRKFEALQRLGTVEQIVGQLDQSETLLKKGLEWAEIQEDNQAIVTSYLNLGNTKWALVERSYSKKLQEPGINCSMQESLSFSEQTACRAYDKNLSDYQRDLDQAPVKFYTQAFNVATSPLIKLQAQLNQFTLLTASEQWNKAIAYKNSIQPPLQILPPSRASIYGQVKYGNNALKIYANYPENALKINEIDQILKVAILKAEELGDRKAESHALKTLGRLYESDKQWDIAQDLTEKALKIAPTYNNPELAYQLSWQLGRIYREQRKEKLQNEKLEEAKQKLQAAIASYSNAFDTLESLRGDLVAISPELQFSFRESVEPVYRELVDLRLEKAEQLKEVAEQQEEFQAEMIKVRDVIESLQLAELNNFFRDACVEKNPQIIDKVSPTAAVIYPIILKDRLEIILSLPDGEQSKLDLYTEPVIAQDINQALVEFRDLLEPPEGQKIPDTAPQKLLILSQEIYNWLIRPIEAQLEDSEIDTLVFVLDGLLRNIPMSALHDGNQYLVQRYAIALTPGLQLLNPEPITEADLVGLLAGAENADIYQQEGFSSLPAVPKELTGVGDQLPNSRKLQDNDFTRQELQRLISQIPFPVIHLATHGNFGSTADDTYILTSDERVNVKTLEQFLQKPDEKNPIELLVLSACETAEGDDRAALGLAGIAVRAGARSTLATLWTVADDSTAELMVKFYEELVTKKLNKAEALRAAQLKLLENKLLEEQKTNHPFYWAPFVLVGNWQ